MKEVKETPKDEMKHSVGFLKKVIKMKHTAKHPGFAKIASKIASKEGVSSKAASAILAARTRAASAEAHKVNPKLNRVKD